jgi:hypothetical protein
MCTMMSDPAFTVTRVSAIVAMISGLILLVPIVPGAPTLSDGWTWVMILICMISCINILVIPRVCSIPVINKDDVPEVVYTFDPSKIETTDDVKCAIKLLTYAMVGEYGTISITEDVVDRTPGALRIVSPEPPPARKRLN